MTVTQLRDGNVDVSEGTNNPSDPYIRVGDVLSFTRQHYVKGPSAASPEFEDSCLIVEPARTKPFQLKSPEEWASYGAIARRIENRATGRKGEGGARYIPFSESQVFAPLRLILPDSGPLRAALSYAPVYPTRGKLGLPQPGADLWLFYAALGVLNSPLAAGWYLQAAGRHTKVDYTKISLESIPIVSREVSDGELSRIAFLVHQIVSLIEAQQEGGIQVSEQIEAQRTRLEHSLIRAQRLSETDYRLLTDPVRMDLPGDYTSNLFEYAGILPSISSPVIVLLSDEDRQRFLEMDSAIDSADWSESEFELYELLRIRYHWHEVVNTPPPRRLVQAPSPSFDEPTNGEGNGSTSTLRLQEEYV